MGLIKDFLITIHNGGDEAVAAVQRMGEDWRAMLEQAASEIERRWIPVTDRLPEDDLMCLVWSNSNGLHLAYLDSFRKWRDADHNPGKKITHWMPLPAPPTDAK